MIVDSGLNIGLAVGQDRRLMQEGDAQVVIPPTILPVVLALQPLAAMPGQNDTPVTSFLYHREFSTPQNTGAAETRICILSKGLWELELSIASWFNYAMILATPSFVSFTLDYQGTNLITLLKRYATSGSFTDYNRLRILLQSDADINAENPVTGVGQNCVSDFTLNAIRIL